MLFAYQRLPEGSGRGPVAALLVVATLLLNHAVAALPMTLELDSIDVAPVWSGHPVSFAIETTEDSQYVGFYDPRRRMTVAKRQLSSTSWEFTTLPTSVNWDSHNGIALAVDRDGYLHVSGNMHGDRLIYFRSTRSNDISRFLRLRMVGSLERKVTYPQLLKDGDGNLYFEYRHGKSGAGARIINRYDTESRQWSRLTAVPLFDGRAEESAYLSGPVTGPDGLFHLVWVWRKTPFASSNHDISYARSADLSRWESVAGKTLQLPLSPATSEAIVDPVPIDRGLVGGGFGVGWDQGGRPVVTYLKYGPRGATQAFNARWEEGSWQIRQTSSWEYRWELALTGTLPWSIVVNPVGVDRRGRLTQNFDHLHDGRGVWVLDEASLRIVERLEEPRFLARLRQVESSFPGMEVRPFIFDRHGEYFLRWETLPINRDRRRKPPYPPPTTLRIYRWPTPSVDSDIGPAGAPAAEDHQ